MTDGARALDDFTGKVSIVTGAASLIGVATITLLLDREACVLATDLDDNARLVAGLAGPAVLQFEGGDLADESYLQRVVAAATRSFGGVDHLVNIAALFDDPLLTATQDDWRRSFDVNVIAAARLSH